MLIAILKPSGKRPSQLTNEEQNDLLEPFVPTLVGAAGMLRECCHQYRLLGVTRVHQQLHGQPGVDHEMLDQAVEFHSQMTGSGLEDEPLILER